MSEEHEEILIIGAIGVAIGVVLTCFLKWWCC
jgi:hypothetical protein